MTPYYDNGRQSIYAGDNLARLRGAADAQFDALVSDPPYGLSFMGNRWDYDVPSVEFWREALRVLKPGAPLLVFAGSRTFHRMAVNLEDAGAELRDCLMWLYGTGFPKSLDISKAIDKAAGQDRPVIGASVVRKDDNTSYGLGHSGALTSAVPVTAAAAWHGWGTALKPAWEPILLAMKPLDGTFAQNALAHGVAGLHLDACRIGSESIRTIGSASINDVKSLGKFGGLAEPSTHVGRHPANLLLDEDAAAMLDAQSGVGVSRVSHTERDYGALKTMGDLNHRPCHDSGKTRKLVEGFDDRGGASRFFYVAKPTEKDKGYYNAHPTVKPTVLMEYLLRLVETPTGGAVLDPFMGSGTTLVAAARLGREAVGLELNEEYCRTAARRINEELQK